MNNIGGVMRAITTHLSKIAVVLVVSGLATWLYGSSTVELAEWSAFDLRMKMRGSQFVNPRIVVIEIDHRTADQLGRPPLSEDKYAEVVRALAEFGVKSIVVNGVFSGDQSSGKEFAAALRETGIGLLAVDIKKDGGLRASDTEIRLASKGEGHRVLEPDSDGVLRSVSFRFEFEGDEYIALGLRAGLEAYSADPKELVIYPNHAEVPVPSNPKLRIPLHRGRHLLNWPGRWTNSFTRVSFVDVLTARALLKEGQEPRLNTSVLKGAICVIGVTVTGLHQNFTTPIESEYPSVGVQAVMLNSVLERRFLKMSSVGTNISIIWCLCIIIFLVVFTSSFAQSLLRIILLGIVYAVLSFALFFFAGLALPLAYPLIVITSAFAVLTLYHQIISYIERIHLMRLVTKDPMTMLFNYAHFQLLLLNEVRLADEQKDRKLSILMLDIDHFKRINDTYGHSAGDEVIRALAEILKYNCRSLDAACRYGGEEFLLMLPGATLEDAGRIAERIRKSFFETTFTLGEAKVSEHISVSIGVAHYFHKESLDAFLRRSDRALYTAKEAGRNMICRA